MIIFVKSVQMSGLRTSVGVDLTKVQSAPVGDKRFEREKANRDGNTGGMKSGTSSTVDAMMRMAAGLDGRTLGDKINDPNRPTWEQYKKENEDKLDMGGAEAKKQLEYRAQLDADRDQRLLLGSRNGKKTSAISDSEDEGSGDDEDSNSSGDDSDSSSDRKRSKKDKKREKKEKKKRKKDKKKDKKEKKKKRRLEDDDDSTKKEVKIEG